MEEDEEDEEVREEVDKYLIQHIDRRDIIHTAAADTGTASTKEEVKAYNNVSSYRRRSPQPKLP